MENTTIVLSVMKKSDTSDRNSIYRFVPSTRPILKNSKSLLQLQFSFIFYFSFFMETFVDAAGNEVSRTKCEIYTRVMGYYRPVTQFNNGKKSEFYTRTCFDGNTVGA